MCFLNVFDFTFKANGGIGGYLSEINEYNSSKIDWVRFVFDNLANIILVIITINIVSGIIIDTFGSIRKKEVEKNKDLQGICFICGYNKEILDRQTATNYGFTTHIKKDHCMWNYLFFIAYLQYKDETEYTGIESYVHD
mmetsp:Transcript_30987/g.28186  ORF Transcript_30987/g.28186 Transcript_30987/m.28186 type:complete len:139 (+) Transcript_30987:1312-1728(+)